MVRIQRIYELGGQVCANYLLPSRQRPSSLGEVVLSPTSKRHSGKFFEPASRCRLAPQRRNCLVEPLASQALFALHTNFSEFDPLIWSTNQFPNLAGLFV